MDNLDMKIDKEFCPIFIFNEKYRQKLKNNATNDLAVCLERNGGYRITEKFIILADGVDDESTYLYVERKIKSLLWAVGGYKILINGNEKIFDKIRKDYSVDGKRFFDVAFFERIYGVPFEVKYVDTIPESSIQIVKCKNDLQGARLGVDVGGSDVKISAVYDGRVLYSNEIIWNPKINSNPDYHLKILNRAFKEAAVHLPRIDSIGVSSAGIHVDNETRVASLFVKVPDEKYDKVRNAYKIVAKKYNAPLTVANDGDVAAMAGAIELNRGNVLGIAMGTSLAAGYVDGNKNLWGWLNELAFVPIDLNVNAEIDEWSGDYGCGVKYLSQDGVIKLAEKCGFKLNKDDSPAEKLIKIQKLVEEDNIDAINIFSDLGNYLAYALLYYREFYDFTDVLLMGRVMSGRGGEIIYKTAKERLKNYGDDITKLILPDEKNRRIGQAVAAAYL